MADFSTFIGKGTKTSEVVAIIATFRKLCMQLCLKYDSMDNFMITQEVGFFVYLTDSYTC